MSITIKSNPDGVTGAIQVNGVDKVTIGASGITAGSFAPNAIAPADIAQKLTLGTSVATTSGVAIDFTGIPAWVKRITVNFSGVSTNGSSTIVIQLGTSGGIQTTGYLGSTSYIGGTPINITGGVGVASGTAASSVVYGSSVLTLVDASGNWVGVSNTSTSNNGNIFVSSAGKSLAGTLDRIRITTGNGTDAFDAGSVNILYE